MKENVKLRAFKEEVEMKEHKENAQALFSKFELSDEDTKDIDVESLTLDQIEEKCYAVLGRKAAQNYSKQETKADGIKIKVESKREEDQTHDRYGNLFEIFAD